MYASEPNPSFLPDFCRTPAVFGLLLMSQVVALMLVLASGLHERVLGPKLVVVSLYLHWITLLSAAALCWLRQRLAGRPVATVALTAFSVLLAVTLIVSEVAFQVGSFLQWESFGGANAHLMFVTRNGLICAIVAVVVLRYFYVLDAWRKQVEFSAEARFAALQARIRPHFLFNSLNSVAALISASPQQAEELIEDLSELFRAILRKRDPWSRLADEIEYGKTYLRIEQLRLGERLHQRWTIPASCEDIKLPLLSLQPLLENAVHHGIELMPEGGTLNVNIKRQDKMLRIEVRNPVADNDFGESGNQIAQDNIRQRLRLLYDDAGCLETRLEQGEYCAVLQVPA